MLVAVLINPHVLDYDLTVLLLAGMLLVDALPITRWWLLAIFVLALVDAPWQLGAIKVQICTVLLISLAVRLWWTVERAQSVMLGKCPVLEMAGLHLRSGRYAA